ncbi:hypothetical protein F5B17DRAFT_422942 [Nemania serpens]|nr:hypothetical protein F5B17DRAFT_422942 [Nemania serpens]
MMLILAIINIQSFFYPIGNTPTIPLTQSIPSDDPADILLLGCSNMRNILFTIHNNSSSPCIIDDFETYHWPYQPGNRRCVRKRTCHDPQASKSV